MTVSAVTPATDDSLDEPRAPAGGPAHFVFRALYVASLPLALLPRPLGLLVVRGLAALVHPLARGLRATVAANRRFFVGDESAPDTGFSTRAVFYAYGRYVLDVFLAWRGAGPKVRATGMGHLARLARRGCGVIIVTTHSGNWERGLDALPRERPDVAVVTARGGFPLFERLRSRLRERRAMNEQLGGDSFDAIALLARLRRGGWVALQGDRAEPGRGEWCPFGAGEAYLPTGFLELARHSGAAVLPVTTRYVGDGELRVDIAPPIFWKTDTTTLRSGLHEALAGAIREAPEQWLMMSPVMRARRESGTECSDRRSGSSTATT